MNRYLLNFIVVVVLLLCIGPGTAHAQTGVPDCLFFPEVQLHVCDPILSRWRAEGIEQDNIPGYSVQESLALFGYPISGELIDGLLTIQYFQKAVFRYETTGAPHVPVSVTFGQQSVPPNLAAAPSKVPPAPPPPPAPINAPAPEPAPVSAPPATTPEASSELLMRNDTGEAITVDIRGPTSSTISMAVAERRTIPVAPGYYEMTLTAYCGNPAPTYFTLSGNIEAGYQYEVIWYCQYQ